MQKEEQLAHSTVYNRIAAIFHFYTINRVNINKSYVSKFISQKKRVRKDVAYTREQISQIINTCNIRQKVVILLLASTGMRVGALHSLKLRDLKRVDISVDQKNKETVTLI